jgi:hypothetical protein
MSRLERIKIAGYIAIVWPEDIACHTIWGIGKTEEETEKDIYDNVDSCLGAIKAKACTKEVFQVAEKFGMERTLRNCCLNDDDCVEIIPTHVAIEEFCAKYSLPDEAYYEIAAISMFRHILDGEDQRLPIVGQKKASAFSEILEKRNLGSQFRKPEVSGTQDIPCTVNLPEVFECKYGNINIEGYVGITDARGDEDIMLGSGKTEETACLRAVKALRKTGEILIYPCSQSVIERVRKSGGDQALDYCVFIDNGKTKFLTSFRTKEEIAEFREKYSLTDTQIEELLSSKYTFHQRWLNQKK